jgi:hypothetical protein
MNKDLKQIYVELKRTKWMILPNSTPEEAKEAVLRYHDGIKSRIDFLLPPSPTHRALHQEMWIEGHLAYSPHLRDELEAMKDMVDLERCGRDCEGRGRACLRANFDVWYAKSYLLPLNGDADEWARNVIEQARYHAVHCLKAGSLEECDIELN